MDLGDLTDSINVVIDEKVYRRSRNGLSDRGPYVIQGEVEMDEQTGIGRIQAHSVHIVGV